MLRSSALYIVNAGAGIGFALPEDLRTFTSFPELKEKRRYPVRHFFVTAFAALAACAAAVAPALAADQKAKPQQAAVYPAAVATPGTALLPFTSLVGLAATNTTTSLLTTSFTAKKFIGFKWIKVGHKLVKVPKYKTVTKTKTTSHSSKGIDGKIAVGCIFGSALSLIYNAANKGAAMGNPLRWRSQAEHERIVASGYEKQFELTNEEAQLASAFCGLGGFAVAAQYTGRPLPAAQPVVARY